MSEMCSESPLNILLADTEYNQYLRIRDFFSSERVIGAKILWCGERDRYLSAVLSGIYDLILMDYNYDTFFVLEQIESFGNHAPIVVMTDNASEMLISRTCKSGAVGVMARKQPDQKMLRHYLLYADMYRNGELTDVFSDVDELVPIQPRDTINNEDVLTFFR